jgi:uncharacterized membrane protein YfcA
MDSTEQKLGIFRAEQEILSRRLSFLSFETIFIFGVPAVLGYFAGIYLENRGVVKVLAYVGPLLLTFVFSWLVLLRKLKSITQKVKNVEEEIKRLAPPRTEENEEEQEGKEDLK